MSMTLTERIRYKYYIWKTARRFKDLGPGDIAIDCGANVGEITQLLAKTGAQVYAFEPNPAAFARLKARFAHFSHVECRNQAVLDRPGSVRLYLHQNASEDPIKWSTGSSVVSTKSNIDTEAGIDVECVDLPAFIRSLGRRVKVLKVDIEGAEIELLNAILDQNLHTQIDQILVETHERIPAIALPTLALKSRALKMGATHIDFSWD